MKRILFLLLLMAAAVAAAPAGDLETAGMVSLPLAEFQKLIGLASKARPLPLDHAITRSAWKLSVQSGSAVGRVDFQIEVFGDAPCLIPLLPAGVSVRGISPAEAPLVLKDGRLGVIAKAPGPLAIAIDLALGGAAENGRWVSVPVPPGPALTAVEVNGIPEGRVAEIPGASVGAEGLFHPAAGSSWSLVVNTRDTPAPSLPPVVTAASAESKVVADGSTLTSARLSIRHQEAFDLEMTLPAGSQLISCQLNGRAILPARRADDTIVMRLPESDKAAVVELAFTGTTSAFQPVRGDFQIALPSTPPLVERWDWRLILPAAYEPVAIEGNVELQPGGSRNVIPLAKEITHGGAPSVRVFYEKPETNKPQ